MVAAARHGGRHRTPVAARAHDQAHARIALQRVHAAHQLRRAEHAFVQQKTRREIDHLDARALRVVEARAQYCGARIVGLLAAHHALQLDAHPGGTRLIVGAAEQRLENRRTVKARVAVPDDACALVDQGADGTVAEDGELQMGWHGRAFVRQE